MSLPALTALKGMLTATVPDVCNTPTPAGPVPIPYPNMAPMATVNLATTSTSVFVQGAPSAMERSMTLTSMGDNAGVAGGVVSALVMAPVTVQLGSLRVRMQGRGSGYVGCLCGHNGIGSFNALGLNSIPSQAKVFVGP